MDKKKNNISFVLSFFLPIFSPPPRSPPVLPPSVDSETFVVAIRRRIYKRFRERVPSCMQLNFQSLLVLIYSREGCSVSAHSPRGGGSEGGGGGHTSIQMFSFPPRFHFPSWNRLPSSRILFKALSYPGVRILQLPLLARTLNTEIGLRRDGF